VHFNWRKLRDPDAERGDNLAWRAELTTLVQLDDELREDGRRVCKSNLLGLCYVLGYCLITEEVHKEAIAFFPPKDPNLTASQIGQGIRRRRTLLYPRNTYKSTLDIANCVQLILYYYMTIAILIMSGSKELAFAFVDQVASFFIKPPRRPLTLFQALFPELVIESQKNSGQFTAAERQHEPAIVEPLIWGNSLESSTTGWHPDVAIYDDIHTNRNSRKFDSRVRVTEQYKLARKILKPTGIEMQIGTCYGPGDVFSDQILTARPGSYDRVYKPAMKLTNGLRLDPNGFPPPEEVELLFPSILSYDFLREEYEGDYESFMSQYMLDSYGAAEIVFAEDQILAAMIDAEDMPMEGKTFIHWRVPCRTMKWAAASGAIGIMHHNRMYIADVLHGFYKPSTLAKLMHDSARKYGQHTIAILDAPGARHMAPILANHALTTGWDIRVNWIEFSEDAGERDTRIRSMEALLASSRLLISRAIHHIKPLMEAMTQYGMIEENGIPDVISMTADNLPISIAAEEADSDAAWQSMRETDKFNLIYNRGQYAPVEPEPEEEAVESSPSYEEQRFTDQGLEVIMPGLE
jgi:hypothetical protein